MKNIFIILVIAFGVSSLNAQVAIERTDVRPNGIMDFPVNATKGILLPRVTNTSDIATTGAVGGALAFNVTTQQVEFFNSDPNVNVWEAMTEASTEPVAGHNPNFSELNPENGTIIMARNPGGTTPEVSDATGVLVLESDNLSLILPQVPDAVLLPSPEAGMICYDMSRKSIAVFNGSVWSFWN